MSRAFVNEDHAAAQAEQPVERRVSEQPNYVTAAGLRLLQQRVAALNAQRAQLLAEGERADKQQVANTERTALLRRARAERTSGATGNLRAEGADWQLRDVYR